VRGKVVAISFPQPTCRPNTEWERFAAPPAGAGFGGFGGGAAPPTVWDRVRQARATADSNWTRRLQKARVTNQTLPGILERAGAAGILTSTWSGGYGVTRIFQARTTNTPTWDLSCEDYGLVARLAERGQGPVVRMQAESEFLGEVPTFNVVAELKGTDLPNEYVLLSAHFDSWDGASGATDNGTGTVTMMEAMRLLKTTYPNPRRTMVGPGTARAELNGSRAFADHPEVSGLQASFSRTTAPAGSRPLARGAGRGRTMFGRWIALPSGCRTPSRCACRESSGGGSDNASFICSRCSGFSLGSAGLLQLHLAQSGHVRQGGAGERQTQRDLDRDAGVPGRERLGHGAAGAAHHADQPRGRAAALAGVPRRRAEVGAVRRFSD
jgi:hypothetical protein